MYNRYVIALMLAAAFFGSFFVTMWLTEPPDVTASGPIDKELALRHISNDVELQRTLHDLGAYRAVNMKGSIDGLTRINGRDVNLTGWVADPDGDDTPLDVLIFAGGSLAREAQTSGERPDVTKAQHLGFGAEKNTKLIASFGCKSGDQPVIVAFNRQKRYFVLPSPRCP